MSLNIVKVDTDSTLVRDMKTSAVLSTDVSGLRKYKENRKRALDARKEHQDTKARLSSLEAEMQNLRKIISDLSTIKGK
jgi:uncharacterized protein YlxW (UPF0749 family)